MDKLAHEMTHQFFGLCIAESDWSEEWVSEGFAMYYECRLPLLALGLSKEEISIRTQLRSLLHYRDLKHDVKHTDPNQQILKKRNPSSMNNPQITSNILQQNEEGIFSSFFFFIIFLFPF